MCHLCVNNVCDTFTCFGKIYKKKFHLPSFKSSLISWEMHLTVHFYRFKNLKPLLNFCLCYRKLKEPTSPLKKKLVIFRIILKFRSVLFSRNFFSCYGHYKYDLTHMHARSNTDQQEKHHV